MYKITYDSLSEGMVKPEKTSIRIIQNKTFTSYSTPGKAKNVADQMRKDGKRGIVFSRGQLIQLFPGNLSEEKVLEIVIEDIKNGCIVAENKTGKKIEIKNKIINKI